MWPRLEKSIKRGDVDAARTQLDARRGSPRGNRPVGRAPTRPRHRCGRGAAPRGSIRHFRRPEWLEDEQPGSDAFDDPEAATPLGLVCEGNGPLALARLLVARGAALSRRHYGRPPLHVAAATSAEDSGIPQHARLELVGFLIDKGADVDERDDNYRRAPRAERLRCFVRRVERAHRSPLFAAALENHHKIVALLLERGADVERTDNWGESSLLVASLYGYVETVLELLCRGASVNHASLSGLTPLWVACRNERVEIAPAPRGDKDASRGGRPGKSRRCRCFSGAAPTLRSRRGTTRGGRRPWISRGATADGSRRSSCRRRGPRAADCSHTGSRASAATSRARAPRARRDTRFATTAT